MAPATDELGDSFSILNLEPSASESDIKKAYRKFSLKFHPDKVSKDVDPIVAANRFHQLNLAYETLMNPAARAKASQKNKQDAEKKKRQEQYEGKRKAMADELEKNEQEFARKKQETAKEERDRIRQVEELKEQAKMMREEKMKEIEASKVVTASKGPSIPQTTSNSNGAASASTSEPKLGPLDLTTRLRFPTINYPLLSGEPSQGDELVPPLDPLSTPLATALQAQFGPLQNLRFQLPSSGKKKKRELTAYATFEHLRDAWRAVLVGGQMKCEGEMLEDVWIVWAGLPTKKEDQEQSSYTEPARVSWYKSKGIATPSDMDKANGAPSAVSFPSLESAAQPPSSVSFVIDAAYESATLQRLRDAERRRMEEEILRQEQGDTA